MELRRTVHVVNEQGLHARPCHAVVAMALEYLAELSVCHGEYQVNGKSILSLMTLNAPQGTELLLVASGTAAGCAGGPLPSRIRHRRILTSQGGHAPGL